ncbi:hypothetical protein CO058_01160 [candidate division WWE3 bacterium CG_4_9_14_0_2_um_filter_35_11]|uniref:Peptidase S33 tripeptidyl aminopeptidase-like C-terminal domain-containing protein n=1 Tax=candidate division WWE3 bacterium CG_4_9_14_0_2_um_filter_35_11 TaxID=1975077 RepID=A0A2M8EM91_UNCKA|nr:MAG: hypothetical protein COV25_02980 [candidate division WWE3 bacterium CG10_big_fil_rev_8_21_14_0_10_35_32]PJC23849.1 MAG: hypothetical protein CO058_01160 [candidate division WWE3 bacterium CG_4_9_14_0_2_um_filter_35_11]
MLLEIDSGGILLIYGTKDSSTPLSIVEDKTLQAGLDYVVIPDGAHNIGQTHPQEIAGNIYSFLHKVQ